MRIGVVFLGLLMASNIVVAQTDEKLYLRSDATVDALAEQIVEGKSKTLPEELKPAYIRAIKDAFVIYWKEKEARSQIKKKDLDKTKEEISALDYKVFASLEELKTRCASRRDSIAVLQDSITRFKYTVDNSFDFAGNLTNDSIIIDSIKKESVRLSQTLKKQRQILNGKAASSGYYASELDRLTKELEELKKKSAGSNNLLASVMLTEDKLKKADAELNKDFSQIDIRVIKDAIASFEASKSILFSFDAAKYSDLEEIYDKLNSRIGLLSLLKDAQEQMTRKFDKNANARLQKNIKSALQSKSVDKKTKAVGNEILAALENQERSYKNLNSLLQLVADNNKGTVDKKFNISVTIADIVDFVNPGKTSYNPYYTNFNRILNDLKNDFEKNKDKINKMGVEKYIEGKKSEL